MRCAACLRPLKAAAGWLGKLPLGPVCLSRIKSAKPKKRKQAAKAVRIDQLDLFDSADHAPKIPQGS